MKINWETKKDGNIEISTFAAINPNGLVINPEFQEAYDKMKNEVCISDLVKDEPKFKTA